MRKWFKGEQQRHAPGPSRRMDPIARALLCGVVDNSSLLSLLSNDMIALVHAHVQEAWATGFTDPARMEVARLAWEDFEDMWGTNACPKLCGRVRSTALAYAHIGNVTVKGVRQISTHASFRPLEFPPPAKSSFEVNMMPFLLNHVSSLPVYLRGYW